MQQLSQTMTAQEFGQHYALELEEPIPAAWWSVAAAMLASLANGPLKEPEPGRIWRASDFMPTLWQQLAPTAPAAPAQPASVADILRQARAVGMRA